jgi:hypothetical protein
VAGLGPAITALAQARSAALAGAAAPGRSATSLDRADAACATGERDAARTARPSAPAGTTATGLRRLSTQAVTYAAGLTDLSRATDAATALSGAQSGALRAVLVTGRAEVAALTALQKDASRVWPTYVALDEAQRTWLERRTAGWYRSTSEAADAYALLTDPLRTRLDTARRTLAARDGALTRASTDQDRALAAADRALESLR